MRARSFMFICAGALMLAAAYQLGVQRAGVNTQPTTATDVKTKYREE